VTTRKRNGAAWASMVRMDDGDGSLATLVEPSRVGSAHGYGVGDFEVFFLEHHLPLYRALWLVTRNRHEAEEIMQDAFLRIWERWGHVSRVPDPTGYLYRTAMNVFRSRARRAAVALRKTVRAIPADDLLEAVEGRDAVVRAMASLTPRQRAAVVLTDVLGLTSEEAAEALGVKAVTVRVLASRGREALRGTMGEGDG
jgi:RNA polymerase sigma factor (sigma-70 family)